MIENIKNNISEVNYISILWNIWNSLTLELFIKMIIIYFFIVWIAIIVWVTKDIINRTNNILLQIISILTVLILTPLWIVIYLLIRPSKTLFEKYYEEWEIDDEIIENEIEKVINEVKEKEDINKETEEKKLVCDKCKYKINSDFKFCPMCKNTLKSECISCHKEINPKWEVCPYCWKDQKEKIKKIIEDKKKKDK